MATVAETLSAYDALRLEERRKTEYPERAVQTTDALATLQDGAGDATATQTAFAALVATFHRPVNSGPRWDGVRAQIAVLANE